MTFKPAGEGSSPSWFQAGLDHVWLPYAQMKTARPPLPVVRTARLPHRARRRPRTDRWHRILVDGLPRLQPSAHPGGGRAPTCDYAACHVRRACARAGAHAGAAARRPAAGRSRPRVLLRLRLGRRRGRDEDGGAVLAQPGRARADEIPRLHAGGYHGDTTGAMAVSDPDDGMHALFRGLLPEQHVVDLPRDARERGGPRTLARAPCRRASPASSSSRWCRAPAGCCFHEPAVLQRLRDAADRYDAAADLR